MSSWNTSQKKRLVESCMLKSLNFTFEMFFEKKKTINHIKLQAVHLVREGGRVQYMFEKLAKVVLTTYQPGFFKEICPKINLYDRVDWMIGLWKFHMWLRNGFKRHPAEFNNPSPEKTTSWKRSCYKPRCWNFVDFISYIYENIYLPTHCITLKPSKTTRQG